MVLVEGRRLPVITLVHYRWLLDGAELTGETSSTVVLPSISADQNGKTIKCEATNSISSTEAAHTLSINCKCPCCLSNHALYAINNKV